MKSRFDKTCSVNTLNLSELYAKLAVPARSTETLSQYKSAPKSKQDNLKDVGAFIGGKMSGGVRKAGYVEYRDLICLDMDNIPTGQTETVVNKLYALGMGFCVYSTRKHSPEAPRLRVVLPIDRSVTADEYEPIARMAARYICDDLSWFDRTTFDVSRIMYWPSVCADSQYVCNYADLPPLSANGVLALYRDWRDFNEWPKCPAEDITHAPASRQEDPLTKKGVVGAFCRVYSISEAIDKFLPGVYVPAGTDRYTYANGSTTGGAIVYEGKYLYSHHATDPASGQLCNAFDLVRIHKFSSLDDSVKEGTPTHKMPSFTKMKELAYEDGSVSMQIRTEKAAEVYEDFADISDGSTVSQKTTLKEATSWMALLKGDGNGGYVKSYENVLIMLENDPHLKGRIYKDTFSNRMMGIAPLPWGTRKTVVINTPFEWSDEDDSGLLLYTEKLLGIRTKTLMTYALDECRALHPFHPVQDYLSRLVWDGIPRIETAFQRYLGAEDNEYVRAVAKMTFVAAVTRIYYPGIKFDTAVVFVGPQGIGKSTFISTLAKFREWFTDNIKTLDRSAIENIQGVWLAEFGELSALKKNEIEEVKAFMSRQVDRARMSYGKYAVNMPRTCIFFGTTNTYSFLKDHTGERRFYPIDVGVNPRLQSVFKELPNEVDQLWAEALYYLHEGKTQLILPYDIMKQAAAMQESHYERSEMEGLIEEFLNKPIPVDWDSYSLDRRLLFYADTATPHENLIPRSRVCAIEIWCECLHGKIDNYRNCNGREIHEILRRLPGWEPLSTPRKFAIYGTQRGYEKYAT